MPPRKQKEPKFKPLCDDCRYTILNLLDEYKILNRTASCLKNDYYNCKAIHTAKAEFIEDMTKWILNDSFDAGDCIK